VQQASGQLPVASKRGKLHCGRIWNRRTLLMV